MSIFYTRDEVAKHNKETDLWIIIDKSIYDITKFIKEHPGGEEVLLNLAGCDGTECFNAVGHSAEAKQLREMYKIGDISDVGSEEPNKGSTEKVESSSSPNVKDEEPWDYVEHKEKSSPWVIIFLGIAAIVYATIFSYLFR